MTSKKGPLAVIVVGVLLALGPLWGLLISICGMIFAFERTAQAGGAAKAEQLATHLSLSLWSTHAGLAVAPIGLALLIGGLVWLVSRYRQEAPGNQTPEAIAAPTVPPPRS